MTANTLVNLLREMAVIVDKPDGIGGAAILLEAASTIEQLQRRIPPAEPTR